MGKSLDMYLKSFQVIDDCLLCRYIFYGIMNSEILIQSILPRVNINKTISYVRIYICNNFTRTFIIFINFWQEECYRIYKTVFYTFYMS